MHSYRASVISTGTLIFRAYKISSTRRFNGFLCLTNRGQILISLYTKAFYLFCQYLIRASNMDQAKWMRHHTPWMEIQEIPWFFHWLIWSTAYSEHASRMEPMRWMAVVWFGIFIAHTHTHEYKRKNVKFRQCSLGLVYWMVCCECEQPQKASTILAGIKKKSWWFQFLWTENMEIYYCSCSTFVGCVVKVVLWRAAADER